MFITKKHLSRRTVLKGAGCSIALPLLDAMIPAGTALAQDRGSREAATRVHLLPARRDHGSLDADGRGQGLRDLAHPEAAGAVQEQAHHRVGAGESPPA